MASVLAFHSIDLCWLWFLFLLLLLGRVVFVDHVLHEIGEILELGASAVVLRACELWKQAFDLETKLCEALRSYWRRLSSKWPSTSAWIRTQCTRWRVAEHGEPSPRLVRASRQASSPNVSDTLWSLSSSQRQQSSRIRTKHRLTSQVWGTGRLVSFRFVIVSNSPFRLGSHRPFVMWMWLARIRLSKHAYACDCVSVHVRKKKLRKKTFSLN